mmetsp:Transcript_24737/g.53552  ORF Transcript_24737/g.53552 Transcript_24737/m.53552 type:complete len:108 (+) Transcript_24737:512-835(+)
MEPLASESIIPNMASADAWISSTLGSSSSSDCNAKRRQEGAPPRVLHLHMPTARFVGIASEIMRDAGASNRAGTKKASEKEDGNFIRRRPARERHPPLSTLIFQTWH